MRPRKFRVPVGSASGTLRVDVSRAMSEETASITRLFVYGTLLRGGSSHELLAEAVFVESAQTEARFTLVNLGEYPAMADIGSGTIHGEVYLVKASLLARIDEHEGEQYARRTVTLQNSKPAHAYVWTVGRFDESQTIRSGDWRKR